MTDIAPGSGEELAHLLVNIQHTLDSMAADLSAMRKSLETNGDLDHRLGHIEAAIDNLRPR